MTEELQKLFLRSDAAIREAKRLIEVNEQLRIYSEDVLERMRQGADFRQHERPGPAGCWR